MVNGEKVTAIDMVRIPKAGIQIPGTKCERVKRGAQEEPDPSALNQVSLNGGPGFVATHS
jgi:hypothetical protein